MPYSIDQLKAMSQLSSITAARYLDSTGRNLPRPSQQAIIIGAVGQMLAPWLFRFARRHPELFDERVLGALNPLRAAQPA